MEVSTRPILQPGDLVVLTGEMTRGREDWEADLLAHGSAPWRAVTKKVKLVVAADPDSESGKARKARDYGIPIVNEPTLAKLVEGVSRLRIESRIAKRSCIPSERVTPVERAFSVVRDPARRGFHSNRRGCKRIDVVIREGLSQLSRPPSTRVSLTPRCCADEDEELE